MPVGDSDSMKSALREMVSATSVTDIRFQSASVDIWEKKYRLTTKAGEVIDHAIAAFGDRSLSQRVRNLRGNELIGKRVASNGCVVNGLDIQSHGLC